MQLAAGYAAHASRNKHINIDTHTGAGTHASRHTQAHTHRQAHTLAGTHRVKYDMRMSMEKWAGRQTVLKSARQRKVEKGRE